MKKLRWLFLSFFYAAPYILLFFNQDAITTFCGRVYTSDILYPFSLYNAWAQHSSNPDWVFGGYTPFTELGIGFVLWVATRNVQITYLLYAVLQPALICSSLLFLTTSIAGRNNKVQTLTVLLSIVPVLLCTSGVFQTGWELLIWYRHGTTLAFSMVSIALLIRLVTISPAYRKRLVMTGISMGLVIIVAALSDALFISQFIAPSIATVLLQWLLKRISFRRAAYTVLFILYASALGLSFYHLPALWGSERVVIYGSYIQFTLERLLENVRVLALLFNNIIQGSVLIGVVWVFFYVLCFGHFVMITRRLKHGLGFIQSRLLILFSFMLLQLGSTIFSSLFTTTPGVRYVLPIVFIPIFWGWIFLAVASPAWIKTMGGQKMNTALAFLSVVPALVLLFGHLSFRCFSTLGDYTPQLVRCIDQGSEKYHLRRGMANYWQARLITLLSKYGVEAVQVTPDLAPYRILNNTDGYREAFDFVVITHNPKPGLWMDRDFVIQHYGEPAATFYCGINEIMVYNRPSDEAFRHHFDSYFSMED